MQTYFHQDKILYESLFTDTLSILKRACEILSQEMYAM